MGNSKVPVVSIKPTKIDIVLVKDTDNELEFILTDGLGEPVNLTDSDVVFTAFDAIGGTVQLGPKTNTPGNHTDSLNGKSAFKIARTEIDDETNPTTKTFWVYEVRRKQITADLEHVHITGQIIILPTGVC